MPNGLRFEHLCDIVPKARTSLVVNLPAFVFFYIHFNVPPTRITEYRLGMYQMKRSIDIEQSLLSMFLLSFFNLVCVQSVIQLINTPFITLVL